MSDPGTRTELVTIRYTEDGTTWATRCEPWVKVTVNTPTERPSQISDDTFMQHTYELLLRARDDIEDTDVIVWEGAALKIVGIVKQPRAATMTIQCEAGGRHDAVPV